MFNPSSIVIEAFVEELVDHYVSVFGHNDNDIQLLMANARNALEIIANSDAPYHDVNHTIMVTIVGTEILRGKILIEGQPSRQGGFLADEAGYADQGLAQLHQFIGVDFLEDCFFGS